MKKLLGSLIAFAVLAMAVLACSVGLPKSDTSQANTPTKLEVTNTAEVPNTPEGEQPFELLGIWKTDDLRAPDNSWNISYSVYFQFADGKQYVYHGVDTFNINQPTDISDIVYLNISDSTFIKKMVYIPDHPESLGKFQKWTWRFDNGNVLFTVYGMMDSQDLALNDGTVTALATGVKVQQSQSDVLTPIPSTAPSKDFVLHGEDFAASYQGDCDTDVTINSVEGTTFNVGGTLSMRNGEWVLWCYGAKHTWLGTLTYAGYVFNSGENDPLQFVVTENGYKYVGGSGTVTSPDSSVTTLP